MKKLILVLLFLFSLSACEGESPEQAAAGKEPVAAPPTTEDIAGATKPSAANTASMLLYKVNEPGVDPYESRTIITEDYIRLDDNNDGNNFALVDRKAKIVYSVSEDNSSILVVKQQPITFPSPIELHPDTQRRVDKAAPMIGGRQLVHYIFRINGEACQDATIAEGLMMDAVAALAEYRRLLAGQHAVTLKNVPADERNACDLAMHIFEPDRHLQFGLPIHERDRTGFERSLVDYDDAFELDEKLFELPPFEQFTIDELMAPSAEPAEEPAAVQG